MSFKAPHIVLVEDETELRQLLENYFKREGYLVTSFADGISAYEYIDAKDSLQKTDLFVVDWMVPGLSGIELCRKIQNKVSVLMITARTDAADIVLGLEAGADDYLTKPFPLSVLGARVRALLRRKNSKATEHVIEIEGLKIDALAHRLTYKNEEIGLTPSEFKAIHCMAKNQGRILSRRQLMDVIQGEGIIVTDRAIDTMIFGLRKKMGFASRFVETVRGIGYRIKSEMDAQASV